MRSVDRSALPPRYAHLKGQYQDACYQEGNRLFEAGKPYAALSYYREIPGYRNVDDKLTSHTCYLILGEWTDLQGRSYVFHEDGTCELDGETLVFHVSDTVMQTGAEEGALTHTHTLNGVTRRNAWMYDLRSGAEVLIYLTRAAQE